MARNSKKPKKEPSPIIVQNDPVSTMRQRRREAAKARGLKRCPQCKGKGTYIGVSQDGREEHVFVCQARYCVDGFIDTPRDNKPLLSVTLK